MAVVGAGPAGLAAALAAGDLGCEVTLIDAARARARRPDVPRGHALPRQRPDPPRGGAPAARSRPHPAGGAGPAPRRTRGPAPGGGTGRVSRPAAGGPRPRRGPGPARRAGTHRVRGGRLPGDRTGAAGRDRPAGSGLAAASRPAARGNRGCRACDLRLFPRAGTIPCAGLRRDPARVAAGRRGGVRRRPGHVGAGRVRGRPGDRGRRRGRSRAGGVPGGRIGRALPAPAAPGCVRGAHPAAAGPAGGCPAARGAARRGQPLRPGWLDWPDAGTVICRCEQTRWPEIGAAVAAGARDVPAVMAATGCGLGDCRARVCGPALRYAVSSFTFTA